MEGRPDRQRPGGSVAPVLRDTSGYTLAVIFNLLSPLLLLLFSLFSFSSTSRAGRRRGARGGGQSAANRSLGSCLLLIFWERRRLVVLFRRFFCAEIRSPPPCAQSFLCWRTPPSSHPHPPRARRPAHVCWVAAARHATPAIVLIIHPDCVSSIGAGHSHGGSRPHRCTGVRAHRTMTTS